MESKIPPENFLDTLEPIGSTPNVLEVIAVKLSRGESLTKAEQSLAELYKSQLESIIDTMDSISVPPSENMNAIASKLDIDPFLNPVAKDTPTTAAESVLPKAEAIPSSFSAEEIKDLLGEPLGQQDILNTTSSDVNREEKVSVSPKAEAEIPVTSTLHIDMMPINSAETGDEIIENAAAKLFSPNSLRDTLLTTVSAEPILGPSEEVLSTDGSLEKMDSIIQKAATDEYWETYSAERGINQSALNRAPGEKLVGGVTVEEANKIFEITPEQKVVEKKPVLPGLGSVSTPPLSSEEIIKGAVTQAIPQISSKISSSDGSLEKLTDITNASQRRITELETKLSSDEFSDAEKGLFEEERDVLKQIIELNKKPEEKAQSKSEQKIEAAIAEVVSGTKESVTIELEAASEYLQSLKALSSVAQKGARPEIKKAIDAEYNSAAPKYNRAEASLVALAHLKEQLGTIDPLQNIAEYNKVEKKIATLEKISGKLEAATQKRDRSFAEKGLDFFKNNIAERWRTGKWYTKVGVGLALAGAGLAAATIGSPALISAVGIASIGLRGLGVYSVYQGVKNSELAKLGNVKAADMTDKVFKTGTEAEKAAAIEQIIAENSLSWKGFFWGGVVGLVSFGAQPVIEHSNAILEAFGVEHAGAATPDAVAVNTGGATPEAIAAGAGAATPDAASLIPGGMSDQVFKHATVAVKEGDTMYKILTEEFNISKHLPEEGRQYNAIENILNQIKADPAAFGITSGNVDQLAAGDTINIAKISEIVTGAKMSDGLGIFEHASKLPDSIVKGIEAYMPAESKAILAAAVEQKVAVATETVANSTGSVAAAPAVENTASVAANTASIPEAQPTETPTTIVGETAPTAETVSQLDEAAVNASVAEAINLMKYFESQGINYTTLVRDYGTINIQTLMNLPNPDEGTQKIINFIKSYSTAFNMPIPATGNVLQYLTAVPK